MKTLTSARCSLRSASDSAAMVLSVEGKLQEDLKSKI